MGHARSKVSGHSASGAGRVRFGEDNAECRGDGGWRSTSPSPAGAKQAKAAHGGAQPIAGEGRRVELSVAEEVGHARSKVSGHSASGAERVRLEDNAECRGDGGWRSTSPSPAGAKQAKAAHGGARPNAGEGGGVELSVAKTVGLSRSQGSGGRAGGAERVRLGEDADATRADCPPDSERGGLRFDARQHTVECQLSAQRAFEQTTRNRVAARRCGESARECLELAAKLRASHTDVERKTGNGGDSRGGGSDAFVRPERVRGNHSFGHLWPRQLISPTSQSGPRRTRPSPTRSPRQRHVASIGRQSAFACRAARRAERFEAETAERGSSGSQLPTARQPTSRVHRVADFAKWADPGCGGSESRRGCGLNDVRLARGTPPTEVGSAHGADGRGEG